jgi:hypothetical protein
VFRVVCGVAVAAFLGLVAAVVFWSGAMLAADSAALARVEVQPLGGTLESARAYGPDGREIPLVIRGGKLTPRTRLLPGERVSVEVVVRRPSWLGWALGKERRERLSLRTPVAGLSDRWLTVSPAAALRVRFDQPISSVKYRLSGGPIREIAGEGRSVIALGLLRRPAAGSVDVTALARPWERYGRTVTVSWFPASPLPVVISRPAVGALISPVEPIRLTFSKPLADVFASKRPSFAPPLRGRWHQTDSHTLTFVPSGLGAGLASDLHLQLPQPVGQATETGAVKNTRALDWTVPPGSLLRLQQLLAAQGYLPVNWLPSGPAVARTARAELSAAIDPPSGSFAWRYPNAPAELQALWTPGQPNQVTRGAVMMFEHDHGLAVDAFAGPHVWQALLADAIAGRHRNSGYSYVYVHRNIPQLLTLWHNGQVVLTSPGNTGVPAAPTQLGTWPVFEHIPSGTMSGTNPNGSHYNDPGIRWISYFHGGDALHAFTRASFGTPQSLGCVELPLAVAARVWPYTPIGTLVTIEN